MRYKGHNFRRNPHYLYRDGDPLRDVDSSGYPVKDNYFVIVRVKDCELINMDDKGRLRYKADKAPQAFPLSYSRTNMGYGKERKYKDRRTRAVYLAYRGQIWSATIVHSKGLFNNDAR